VEKRSNRRWRAFLARHFAFLAALTLAPLVFASPALAASMSGNAGTGGAAIAISQGGTNVTTVFSDLLDNSYSGSGLDPGVYDVTPSKAGYSFSPSSQGADVTLADATGVDFAASLIAPPNQNPTASLTPGSSSGNAPLAVDFNGSGSSDPDAGDSIASWSLDFGDGTTDMGGSGDPPASIPHSYNKPPGSFTATLTVTDTHGGMGTDQASVTINNRAPSASLTPASASGTAPLVVNFNGSGSSDPDFGDSIVSWSMTFGDGGSTGTMSGAAPASISHTYTSGGVRTATLTVHDQDGLTGTDTATITVNGPPSANLASSPSPASGTAPLNVSFTASGSDPDGDPLSWTLAFGDGTSASGSGLPASVPYQYATGNYTATLTVTDGRGGSATDTVAVSASAPANRNPTATLGASPTSGRVPLAVGFSVSGSDPDADALTYSLNYGDGSAPQTGSVPATPSHTYTTANTFTATLTVSDGRGGSDSDTKVITVNPQPSLSIGNAAVTEGASGTVSATFTLTLSATSDKTATVDVDTADGSATSGGSTPDYQTQHFENLSFAPGTLQRTVSVPVNGDLLDEAASETFTVNLSGAVNATIGDASGTGTINDDDSPPTLSIGDTSGLEGNSGTTSLVFTVDLSTASGQTVTVGYATAAGTASAGGDFTTANGTVTFNPGQTTKTLSVPLVGDTVDEANETFTVNLSGPTNATIADGAGTGTIIDDDGAPALSLLDAPEVIEENSGTTPATFEVRLAPASGQNVTVSWTTVGGGSATSGSDFAAATGSLTFTPGQTSKTFTVSVVGDTADEADIETFLVKLISPVNAVIGDADGMGRIVDDDSPPAIPPPDATTAPASVLTQTTATIGGTVNPKGRTTTVYFEYGLTEEYGTRTGNQTASGTSTQAFSAGLTGLGSGTTYHYRIVASNDAGGTTYGSDMTFTTASPPPPPPPPATTVTTPITSTPPPPPPPVGIGPKFELISAVGIGFNGTVIIHVSCPDEACDGEIELATVVETRSFLGGVGRRTVLLGDGTFSVRNRGQTAALVKLSKEGWKLLRQKKKLQAKASIVARNKKGAPTTAVKDLKIALIRSPISFGKRVIRALPSGLVELRLTCIAGRAPCRGTIGLAAKPRGSKRATRLGTEPFTLPAGRTDFVSVLLNDKGRKLLLKQRQLLVSVTLKVRMGSGPAATVRTKITLKAPLRGFQ
jgi:PKD repeat protein